MLVYPHAKNRRGFCIFLRESIVWIPSLIYDPRKINPLDFKHKWWFIKIVWLMFSYVRIRKKQNKVLLTSCDKVSSIALAMGVFHYIALNLRTRRSCLWRSLYFLFMYGFYSFYNCKYHTTYYPRKKNKKGFQYVIGINLWVLPLSMTISQQNTLAF
jgi:hypothetical protein